LACRHVHSVCAVISYRLSSATPCDRGRTRIFDRKHVGHLLLPIRNNSGRRTIEQPFKCFFKCLSVPLLLILTKSIRSMLSPDTMICRLRPMGFPGVCQSADATVGLSLTLCVCFVSLFELSSALFSTLELSIRDAVYGNVSTTQLFCKPSVHPYYFSPQFDHCTRRHTVYRCSREMRRASGKRLPTFRIR